MSAERFTLDANLLVYAVDRDAGDRRQQAIAIVDRAVDQDCVLTLQGLTELFYTVIGRKWILMLGFAPLNPTYK